MKGSCAEKSGSIGGLPFFNQQADGLEIPGFVSGIVQARPAVEKSELCQVTENKVEPLSQWVDAQYVADRSNDVDVVSPHIEPHFVQLRVYQVTVPKTL